MPQMSIAFGFWPVRKTIRAGKISISPLYGFEECVSTVERSKSTHGDWTYMPFEAVSEGNGAAWVRPSPLRIFSLPKTHTLSHSNADGNDHLLFHLWALSFFLGMRFTAERAGFLDATPIKPGMLVDFELLGNSEVSVIEKSEDFWVADRVNDGKCSKTFGAGVNALMLAQNPRLLQFEKFTLLYCGLDACFAIWKQLFPPKSNITHVQRVQRMCEHFKIDTPAWADPGETDRTEVAYLRNATLHEGLFMEQPLGFAVHGNTQSWNLVLELRALLCRLLFALICGADNSYVRSPTDTRQQHGIAV